MSPTSRPARLLVALLLPLTASGAYLAWVPDRVAFCLSQTVVVAHVVGGLLGLPLVVWLTVKHARGWLSWRGLSRRRR